MAVKITHGLGGAGLFFILFFFLIQFMEQAHKMEKKACSSLSLGELVACLATSKTIQIVFLCRNLVTISIE